MQESSKNMHASKSQSAGNMRKKDFILFGNSFVSKIPFYNGLSDKNLAPFFYNERIRQHLLKMGLVNIEFRIK